MRSGIILLLLLPGICNCQKWSAEIMTGVTSYNGDLTQKDISFTRMRPAVNLNVHYNSGDFLNFRAGVYYGQIGADDKNNANKGLIDRNLNFKSDLIEINFCLEFNLFDPEVYSKYPYFFIGAGLFHFNPYTFDKDNKRIFLQPLGTEGQGLQEYPGRKEYSLTQFCIPFGVGWKINYKKKIQISYEFGNRFLFTDYLDDVSKTYAAPEILGLKKGPKTAELSYRKNIPFNELNEPRGNNKVRDYYFFSGIKFSFKLGKDRTKKKSTETEKEEEKK